MVNTGKLLFPSVDPRSIEEFSKQWNYNGISVMVDKTTKQFALDFANIALRSFIEAQVAQYQARLRQMKKLKKHQASS